MHREQRVLWQRCAAEYYKISVHIHFFASSNFPLYDAISHNININNSNGLSIPRSHIHFHIYYSAGCVSLSLRGMYKPNNNEMKSKLKV